MSKKASLRQLLDKKPDKAVIDKSKPYEFMDKFHVHVVRPKTTENWMSERSVFANRQFFKTLTWVSGEEMNMKFGSHPVFLNCVSLKLNQAKDNNETMNNNYKSLISADW